MPQQKDFNTKTNADPDNFILRFKAKGDSFHIRVLAPPFYEVKHIIKNGDKWDVTDCPRIQSKQECQTCEKYFALKQEAKAETDKNIQTELNNKANVFRPKISFYYPVIDREDGICKVLQTSPLIRQKIDTEVANGINVTEYDYIVKRTDNPGSEFYTLTRIDSKETKPLTDEEKAEVGKYPSLMGRIENGKNKSTQNVTADVTNSDFDL